MTYKRENDRKWGIKQGRELKIAIVLKVAWN